MAQTNSIQAYDPVALTLRSIYDTYGDTASAYEKNKLLDKFGENDSLNTADGSVTVSSLGVNNTRLTDNLITHVVSSDAADTQLVVIEGHTIDGSGNLTFVVQHATLTGTTAVVLGTPLARASRLAIVDGAAAAGDVQVRVGTGGEAFVEVQAGSTQSQKCETSISATDYFICFGFSVGVIGGNPTEVLCRFEQRQLQNHQGVTLTNPVWRPLTRDALLGSTNRSFQTYRDYAPFLIPRNSDVRVIASTNSNNTFVSANFWGVLASARNS